MMNITTNNKETARGILHEYRKPNNIGQILYCPVKKKMSDFLIWSLKEDKIPYDTFCNLCGHQCNAMKD